MIDISASDRIRNLKERMTESASKLNLRSLFLIGSCSDIITLDEWYQDYDIHFLFNEINVPRKKLDLLRGLLQKFVLESDQNCKIEYFVKDRHWKMIPQTQFGTNIGIHTTLLNPADHYCRLHCNPVLAKNMYGRCNVLYGDHPANIRGYKYPSLSEYISSVGGIGWLAENFSRVVALYQLNSEDHTFYPFISGYCWNITSSLMFHIYTLLQNDLSGRKQAFHYFLTLEKVKKDKILFESANFIFDNRENPSSNKNFSIQIINATGNILKFVKEHILSKIIKDFNYTLSQKKICKNLYFKLLSPLEIPSSKNNLLDINRDETLPYFDSIALAIDKLKNMASSDISPKENFEFIREMITSKKPLTKIRIWDSISNLRYFGSHDFDLDNGIESKINILFGWEDGLQTLLQRLNEIYIEKSGIIDEEFEILCHFVDLLAQDRVKKLKANYGPAIKKVTFDSLRVKLAKTLEYHCFFKNL